MAEEITANFEILLRKSDFFLVEQLVGKWRPFFRWCCSDTYHTHTVRLIVCSGVVDEKREERKSRPVCGSLWVVLVCSEEG